MNGQNSINITETTSKNNYIWMALDSESKALTDMYLKTCGISVELDPNQPLADREDFNQYPDEIIKLKNILLSPEVSNVDACNFILRKLNLTLEAFYSSNNKEFASVGQGEDTIKLALISKVRQLILNKNAILTRRRIIDDRKIKEHFAKYRELNTQKLIQMNKDEAIVISEDVKAGIEFAILSIQNPDDTFNFEMIIAQTNSGVAIYKQQVQLNTDYITNFILSVKYFRELKTTDADFKKISLENIIQTANSTIPDEIRSSNNTTDMINLIRQALHRFRKNQSKGNPEYSELYQEFLAAYEEEYTNRLEMRRK